MIKEVIKNKPANLFLSWQKRKQYFWRVVSLKIYVFIISVLVSLLLGVVATIIYVLVSLFTANPLGIASYISIIISLLVIILVKIAILFRYPALFLNIQKPVNALKDSINIFLKKPRFAVKVWLLIVGVTLLFTFISIVFHALDSTVQLWLNSFTQFFSIIFATVFILVELVPFIWSDIFLFSLYSKLKNQ